MRLQASLTMLHLARMDIYSSVVMPNFGKLVLTIQVRLAQSTFTSLAMLMDLDLAVQDTCYGVRSTFLNKLIAFFMTRKLPPPYGVVFFLTVHDPEEDVRSNVSVLCSNRL